MAEKRNFDHTKLVQKLSHMDRTELMLSLHEAKEPLPSLIVLDGLVKALKAVLFPYFFGEDALSKRDLPIFLKKKLEEITPKLIDQLHRGFHFQQMQKSEDSKIPYAEVKDIVYDFMEELPLIRQLLLEDAKAAYEGDPAAQSIGEVIYAYPSLRALTHHRIAHCLYRKNVPIIPRIISEMAHSKTGIDIHPGAQIQEGLFIDHGTGVVIGETCEIGRNCRLYQGVTLGALSFSKNADGTLVKGVARHPILGHDVTVYAGAAVLGRVTIGDNAVIGGNVWVTSDVAAGDKKVQEECRSASEEDVLLGRQQISRSIFYEI